MTFGLACGPLSRARAGRPGYEGVMPAGNPGPSNAVLVVDDDGDLAEILKLLFEDAGATCLTAATLEDVEALGDRALGAGLAILDINLGHGQPTGVDVSRWLIAHGFRGRIVFLTGHAQDNPALREALAPGGTVLSKPAKTSVLLGLLPRVSRHDEARR